MQKKSIFTILGVMLAVVVTSLTLVFAVGPRVSADSEVVLNQESHFKIIGSYHLTGISDEGKSLINGKNFRVVIPSSVTSIGYQAFCNSGLTSIEIPSSVTSIGGWAFYGCIGLTTVTFAGNSQLTSIGDVAFYYCSSLTSIEIPSGVTSIGDGAFKECSSLTSIEIPSSVASIGSWAFFGCRNLTSIEIPSGVTSIGDEAFRGCSGLTTVTFAGNSQLTSIGDEAFHYCSGLTSITIPSSVASIGDWAFHRCSGLTHIRCEASEKPDGWSNGWLGDCNPDIVEYGYVAPQDTNNQETSNTVTENNKFNPLMAWVGGGIAAGLSVICGVAIVVAKKRRK